MSGNSDSDETRRAVSIVVAAAGITVASTGIHGFAHVSIPVPTPGLQAVYVAIVLFGLPVTAAVLARRGRVRIGAWLALLAGVGAVGFEGLAHFLIENPDHVSTVETGQVLFGGTAGLSLLGDVVLVLASAWVLWGHDQGRPATAVRSSTR